MLQPRKAGKSSPTMRQKQVPGAAVAPPRLLCTRHQTHSPRPVGQGPAGLSLRTPLPLPSSDTTLSQQGDRAPAAFGWPQVPALASQPPRGVMETQMDQTRARSTTSQHLSEQVCQVKFSADKSQNDGHAENNLNCTDTLMSCEN